MVDFTNILLMLWTKLFNAYCGFTGYKAIQNLLAIIYDWLELKPSKEKPQLAEYQRCFLWLRWEAEALLFDCKTEISLRGNYWVEKLIYKLIDYLESHHVNILPEWEQIINMDKHRNAFNSPTLDYSITLDKIKGIRNNVIEYRKER